MRQLQNFTESKKTATELLAFQVGSWWFEAAAPGGEQVVLEEAGRVVSDEVDFNLKGS